MSKEKQVIYTQNDKNIVAVLRGAESPMTLTQINEVLGEDAKVLPGHIVAAMKKGLVVNAGKITVNRPVVREVNAYRVVSIDQVADEDGKVKYSDNEKAILAFLNDADLETFTLAQLSDAMGRKLTSGNVLGLIKKGNIAQDHLEKVNAFTKAEVSTYVMADGADTLVGIE